MIKPVMETVRTLPLLTDAQGIALRPHPHDVHLAAGQCPNGHGPMQRSAHGQRCQQCGYSTNIRPEDYQ